MATPAIRTRDLTKDYAVGFWRKRPRRALDRLTMEVMPGEVFGFLGPNGAGKTTTLKLLTGLLFPTAGDAAILGRPVGDIAVKRRIGYLPENPYFYDYLTAEELISYFAGLFGYTGDERRARVTASLDEVGIGAERRMQLRRFSKGMLQRVGIAQALVNEPELLFLDEPMSGLDPIGRREVRSLIYRLRDKGCTVFFCSHILADAEAVCSRIAIIVGGRIVSTGNLQEMLAYGLRGWELVVAGLNAEAAERLAGDVSRVTHIGEGRYSVEIPPDASPERLLADLAAIGARLVSLNPLQPTLEDYFMEQVGRSLPRHETATPGPRGKAPR
jgi:ABC-2 type transport system ATP-binding protein